MSELAGGGGSSSASASSSTTAILENTARYARNLKKYANTRKLSKKNRNSLFKQTRRLGKLAETLRSRHRVRLAPQPKMLDATTASAWIGFRGNIHRLPIYYIACHGATCMSYADCGAPERDTTPPTYPSFILPDNTFMINLVNGEVCHVNLLTEPLLMYNTDNFKNALLVDSPNDSDRGYHPTLESPILSGIHRSNPGSRYPNYKCTFEESSIRMGVFNLSGRDGFGGASLVYYPTDEEMTRPMFVEDIIRRIGPGIFILGACTGPYRFNISSISSSDYATGLVRTNELAYTTRNPTLSLRQIRLIDPSFSIRDPGSGVQVGLPHPALMANLAGAVGEQPATIFPEGTRYLDEASKLFETFKKNATFRRAAKKSSPTTKPKIKIKKKAASI